MLIVISFQNNYSQPVCARTAPAGVKPFTEFTNTETYSDPVAGATDSLGGLYDSTGVTTFSTNLMPFAHYEQGVKAMLGIVPRNTNGDPNWSTGKIGVAFIGGSNHWRAIHYGIVQADTFNTGHLSTVFHPSVTFADCALGTGAGGGLIHTADPSSSYWVDSGTLDDSLAVYSLSREQIAIVILKTSYGSGTLGNWPSHPDSVRDGLLKCLMIIAEKLPNTKVVLISSNWSTQYAASGNLEPVSMRVNFGNRWAIQASINRVDSVDYTPRLQADGTVRPNAPWAGWLEDQRRIGRKAGGYFFVGDGRTYDNHSWDCPRFYEADGLHTDAEHGRRAQFGQMFQIIQESNFTASIRKNAVSTVPPPGS